MSGLHINDHIWYYGRREDETNLEGIFKEEYCLHLLLTGLRFLARVFLILDGRPSLWNASTAVLSLVGIIPCRMWELLQTEYGSMICYSGEIWVHLRKQKCLCRSSEPFWEKAVQFIGKKWNAQIEIIVLTSSIIQLTHLHMVPG